MLLSRMPGLVEKLVRLLGGEPLVAKVDRQAGDCTKFVGEDPRFCGLRAFASVEMKRMADDDPGNVVAPRQPGQRAEVFPPIVAPVESENRLRRKPQLIGDGYADAAIADVESEIAGLVCSAQAQGSSGPA